MNDRQAETLLSELRDRMSDILAAIQLLTPLVRGQGSREDREYLAAMNKSLYRLMRMIRHADICRGDLSCRKEPIDLAGLCRDLSCHCEDMARLLGVGFDWSLGEASVLSLADDHLLELALLNVLTNAFEAAGQGGTVKLKGSLSGGIWRVTVEDDGPGLQVREEEGADPFLKRPGGVGMGLEAARKALCAHDGSLVLDNGKGGGVRAVVSIPIKKPTRDELVHTPMTPWDLWGGFSPLLVEFSPLLPAGTFGAEDLE